jgi:hypothetical protein
MLNPGEGYLGRGNVRSPWLGPARTDSPSPCHPLAELAASLHVLTEHTHHAEHAPWADQVARAAPPAFRSGLRRFAPLWTALRWRAFYRSAHSGRGTQA